MSLVSIIFHSTSSFLSKRNFHSSYKQSTRLGRIPAKVAHVVHARWETESEDNTKHHKTNLIQLNTKGGLLHFLLAQA